MGHRKFNDVIGDINAERRCRIDAIKNDARSDARRVTMSHPNADFMARATSRTDR
jgi:hypothetical protein